MNAQQASKVATSKAGFGRGEVVGPPLEAAPSCFHSASVELHSGHPPGTRTGDLKLTLLLGPVVAVLAPSVSAAESGGGTGFFWTAVLVLAGPALGGLAVCAAMLGWRWAVYKAPWAIGLMASRRWSSRPTVFARADIASVLVPLIDHAGLEGCCTIQIVGSDGGYLAGTKKKVLTDAIRKWVAEGHNFRYILVAPSDEAVAELEALKEQVSREVDPAHERFEVLRLGGSASGASTSPTDTPADVQLLERILHTCHPTLIWSEDGMHRAMWIEGNHPAGADVSYNNQWVPPAAMNQTVQDLPNQTWSNVFSAWDGKLSHLCQYAREQTTIQ